MTPTANDGSWHSYSKIYALGHRATQPLMDGPVLIEEKIDGSQFSFGVFGVHGEDIRVRSRGRVFDVHEADGMFKPACATVLRLAESGVLTPGYTYRGETLQKPRHNALTYGRVPEGNFILFDVETAMCTFLGYEEKVAEAARLGLEIVPAFYEGVITSQGQLDAFKNIQSCLGGTKIEGFVVKAYDKYDTASNGKVLMGKWVSESFKEIHNKTWKADNPTNGDIIDQIIDTYKTTARWQKAVQHLAEAGKINQEPADIRHLVPEVKSDILEDAKQEIMEALFKYAWPKIARGVTRGLPEWYKQQLMEGLFDE